MRRVCHSFLLLLLLLYYRTCSTCIDASLQHRPPLGRGSTISPSRSAAFSLHRASTPLHSSVSLAKKEENALSRNKQFIAYTLVSGIVGYVGFHHRSVWMPFLDKEVIQQKTLLLLQTLQPATDASLATRVLSYSQYVLAFALWECGGLSTIPVETAAGMVWGFPGGLLSLLGKLCGASLAFFLGRTLLAQRIRQQFQGHAILSLLLSKDDSKKKKPLHPPLVTAAYMKFSCFPEGIKNFGSACIPSLRYWMFLLVTLLHGGLFTAIWTWLGVDTAARLSQPALPTNQSLQVALGAAFVVGLVLTPLLMAGWMRDLQRHAAAATERRGWWGRFAPSFPFWLRRRRPKETTP